MSGTAYPGSPMSPISPPSYHRYANLNDEDDNARTQQAPPTDAPSETSSARSSLHTLQWPFHRRAVSSTVESNLDLAAISRPARTASRNRRSFTWGGFRPGTSASVDGSGPMIPDYIRNFLRGETPESMARKRAIRAAMALAPHRLHPTTGTRNPTAATTSHPGEAFFSHPYNRPDGRGGGFSVDGDDQDEERGRWRGGWRRRRGSGPSGARRVFAAGWRAGVALNALAVFGILLVVLLGLVLALRASLVLEDWRSTGDAVVFAGACAEADRISWGALAAANVFAVVAVAAANYVCQVLSSPTRHELDEAHGRWRWLDVGIPSARNLGTVAGWRVVAVAAMMVVALGTQVIYNTIISVAHDVVAADVLVVSPEFLRGAAFNSTSNNNAGGLTTARIETLQRMALDSSSQVSDLTPSECLDAFAQPFQIDYEAVLIIVNGSSSENSLLATLPRGTTPTSLADEDRGMALNETAVDECAAISANTSFDGRPSCRVTMNVPLLCTVAALNLLAVVAYVLVITQSSGFEPLVSLGDALASFLNRPDQTTAGACLLSKVDARRGRWRLREPQHWVPAQLRWAHTVSLRRWLLWAFLWAVPTALVIFGLVAMLLRGPSPPTLGSFGNSSVVEGNLFRLEQGTSRSVLAVFAALPHLALGALYLVTNAHLTTYFVSHELSQYAAAAVPTASLANDDKTTGLPLRITSARPVGVQRTSFYLSLPHLWSWLLVVLFAVAALFLSQALVVVTTVDIADKSSTSSASTSTISALAVMPAALVGLLAALILVAVLVLSLGLRRVQPVPSNESSLDSANPLALKGGTCSAAISARAHPHPGEPDLAGKRVAWGIVSDGEVACSSHASFSAAGVGVLTTGRNYA